MHMKCENNRLISTWFKLYVNICSYLLLLFCINVVDFEENKKLSLLSVVYFS